MARLNAAEVVHRWAMLDDDEYAGAEFGTRSGSAHCRGDTLYNYGRHFPLARFLGRHRGRHRGRRIYLKNGDRHPGGGGFGPSTGQLQAQVDRLCPGPTIPRSALDACGIGFAELTRGMIVAFRRSSAVCELVYDPREKRYYDRRLRPPPSGEELVPWDPPR